MPHQTAMRVLRWLAGFFSVLRSNTANSNSVHTHMQDFGHSFFNAAARFGPAVVLWISMVSPLSAAQVITVGSDQACDTTSLVEAIRDVTNDGTVLLANNQSYDGVAIDIDMKSLTIIGGFPTCSTLNPTGRTTLGRGTTGAISTRFGSVSYSLNLVNLEITGASGTRDGAAIRLGNRTHLTLENVLIHGNQTTGRGGAIYMNGPLSQKLSIDFPGTEIFNNQARLGGGIYCEESAGTIRRGVIELNAGLIRNNRATEHGGGIYLEDCNLTLRAGARDGNSVFAGVYDNQATGDGGGLYISGSSVVVLEPALLLENRPLIDSNRAGLHGGGVYCTSLNDVRPELLMTAGLVHANRAWRGGGLWLGGCDVAIHASGPEQGVQNNVVEITAEAEDNQSPRAGGIDARAGTILTLDGGNRDHSPPEQSIHVTGNRATDSGVVGAIALDGSTTEAWLTDVRIEGNTARSAPAISAGNFSTLRIDHSDDGRCHMVAGPDGCSQIIGNSQTETPNALINGIAVTLGFGAQVEVNRTVIRGNMGSRSSAVFHIQNNSDDWIPVLHVNSSLIVNNQVRYIARNSRNGEIRIAWTTIAGNTAAVPGQPRELFFLQGAEDNTAPLDLLSSIIWQPENDFDDYFRLEGTAEVDQVSCLITHDPGAVTAAANSAVRVVGENPRFGAPSRGDWTVSMSSPAFQCDGSFFNNELDLAGRQRGILTTLPVNPVIFAAGAYSVRSADTLFGDRFEF